MSDLTLGLIILLVVCVPFFWPGYVFALIGTGKPLNGMSILVCTQTSPQKRMMKKFGEEIFAFLSSLGAKVVIGKKKNLLHMEKVFHLYLDVSCEKYSGHIFSGAITIESTSLNSKIFLPMKFPFCANKQKNHGADVEILVARDLGLMLEKLWGRRRFLIWSTEVDGPISKMRHLEFEGTKTFEY